MTGKPTAFELKKHVGGRHNIIQGKTKIELPKTVDASKLTLEEVKDIIAKKAPKKKTRAKKEISNGL